MNWFPERSIKINTVYRFWRIKKKKRKKQKYQANLYKLSRNNFSDRKFRVEYWRCVKMGRGQVNYRANWTISRIVDQGPREQRNVYWFKRKSPPPFVRESGNRVNYPINWKKKKKKRMTREKARESKTTQELGRRCERWTIIKTTVITKVSKATLN